MCWIGHGEILPRDVPANARQTLHIARVNQNHFVPLRRSRRRGGEVPLSYTPYLGAKGYTTENHNRLNFLHLSGISTVEGPYDKPNVTQDTGAVHVKTIASNHSAESNGRLNFLNLCDIPTENKKHSAETIAD